MPSSISTDFDDTHVSTIHRVRFEIDTIWISCVVLTLVPCSKALVVGCVFMTAVKYLLLPTTINITDYKESIVYETTI